MDDETPRDAAGDIPATVRCHGIPMRVFFAFPIPAFTNVLDSALMQGQLGSIQRVMIEGIEAAAQYVKVKANDLGINAE